MTADIIKPYCGRGSQALRGNSFPSTKWRVNVSFPVLRGPSRVGRIRWVQAQDYVKCDRNVRRLGRVFNIDYIKNLLTFHLKCYWEKRSSARQVSFAGHRSHQNQKAIINTGHESVFLIMCDKNVQTTLLWHPSTERRLSQVSTRNGIPSLHESTKETSSAPSLIATTIYYRLCSSGSLLQSALDDLWKLLQKG